MQIIIAFIFWKEAIVHSQIKEINQERWGTGNQKERIDKRKEKVLTQSDYIRSSRKGASKDE